MDIESIDWVAIQTVVTSLTIKQQWWATKFTTGFCMTGQRMHQWGERETATCLCCKHDIETTVYILQCLHPGMQTVSNSCIKDLRSILKDLNMEPETMEDLSKGINSWHLNQPIPLMQTAAGQLQSFIYLMGKFQSQIPGCQLANPTTTIL